MWRKSIHQTIGYYDEQFKCVADFDFQIRTAFHFSFVKTGEILGIYLEDQPHKLSANGLQPLELNIICLRYAEYRYLNFFLLLEAKMKYSHNRMLFFDEWKEFTEKIPFGWFRKVTGVVSASFGSSYWLCRQLAKKIILQTFIKLRKC
jgi:hypothetical protein